MTAGRLAELTGLTTGAITGLVDRLERRGYARRDPHPTDRRVVMVQPLVAQAERDLGASYAALKEAMEPILARYSDAELAVILDFLTRGNVIASEQIARVRGEAAREAPRRA
jgi:DNA-binding MarR family transcriptional regulator